MVVNPSTGFVPICQTAEPFTLDLNRNSERRFISGFLNRGFSFISHEKSILPAGCRFQVTVNGVLPYHADGQKKSRGCNLSGTEKIPGYDRESACKIRSSLWMTMRTWSN